MKKITAQLTIAFAYLSLLVNPAFAAVGGAIGDPCQNAGNYATLCGLNSGKLGPLVGTVINFIFLIAAIIALIYLVLGGLKWITSEGDTKNVEAARNQIIAAAIGLAVTFLSYLIINVLLSFLLGQSLNNLTLPSINDIK